MGKKGRLPADRSDAERLYRSAPADVSRANDTVRSVPLVLATEDPVPVFDLQRMAVVNETLQLDGMNLPQSVPLIDSHDRSTVSNVLGSIRELEVEDGQLHGRAYFAQDHNSTYELYRDGHLSDFSVGAQIVQLERDDDGNRNVTRSRLLEGSAVVAGQDPGAKASAFRAYVDPHSLQEEIMGQELKAALVERGLPTDATDAEAIEFVKTLDRSEPEAPPEAVVVSQPAPAFAESITATEELQRQSAPPQPAEVVQDRSETILAIDAVCRALNIPDVKSLDYMRNPKWTADAVSKDWLDNKNGDGPVGLGFGVSEREKFYSAAEAGMVGRIADSGALNPDAVLARGGITHDVRRRNETLQRQLSDRDSAADLAYVRLPDLARMFLERSGERVDGLPQHEIVRRAIRQDEFVKRSQATHTTGSFTNLMLDAANKTLLAGYDEADYTYSLWVRQAPSASDFKNLNRIRFGEMADPDEIPENNPYPEKTTQDSKETYGVAKHGEIFSISLEAIINDDMNAMTRVPQMQGNAMRREVNKVCYAQLTDNAALSDGVALFHASSHGANLDGNTLAESALDTGWNIMSQQTGLSGSGTPIGLRPSYLIVPTALAATAHRLTGGNVIPTSTGSNVPLYGSGRPRPMTVVEEPQLDGNSTTAWYLAASSGVVETVEITFLQGEETPVLAREDGFDHDVVRYKIRQTFAAKAIDFRGLYQGNA